MPIYVSGLTFKPIVSGGALATSSNCCCECCYDDRTTIDLYNMTGNFSSWNLSYSLSAAASGNCQSEYGGIGSVGCSPPPPSDSYYVETIVVGTTTSTPGSTFTVGIVLQKCDTLGFKTRVNYFSSNLLCGTTAGSASTTSPPAGFPTLVLWRNLA